MTAGAGWGYFAIEGEADLANDPIFMLGGEARVSRRLKLITENYFIVADETFGLFTGGIRLLGDRFSADLGLGTTAGFGEVGCCLPVLSAAYTF